MIMSDLTKSSIDDWVVTFANKHFPRQGGGNLQQLIIITASETWYWVYSLQLTQPFGEGAVCFA